MAVSFRECTLEDLEILQAFSRQRYFETFADMNTPENMTAYLDEAFATEKIRAELSDENSAFYFLYWDDKLAGYLKLNEFPAQTDIHDEQSLEIERIYVSKEFQGEGLGRCLMEKAISTAIRRKKKICLARRLGEKRKGAPLLQTEWLLPDRDAFVCDGR